MARSRRVLHTRGAKSCTDPPDAAIAALAEAQHGVVARRQLVELGLSGRAIEHRLDRRRLHPIHRGVFAVGHRVLSREGRWMAAVLLAGPGAALSHRCAAALWGVRPTARERIEVTLERRVQSRPQVEVHRLPLPADEVTVQRGIPVTTVPRTIFDLAAVLGARQAQRALNEAEVLRLWDRLSLADLLERYPRRRGAKAIREILAARQIGATVTREELERRFLEIVTAAGLPLPETNAHIRLGDRWIEADCLWRERRLIAELDGHATHSTRAAYERDRERDRRTVAAGWRVVRITWRQLHDEPAAVLGDLRILLGL